jgi:uncharacterized protein with NAD-binding domain and iron-sulfur cluster
MRKRIAILGGGMSSLVTAYQLTNLPDWQDQYELTVYQMGWRLGGKGASGRNVEPDKGDRIEEHGLHLMFGFYDNALGVMRDVYEQLGRKPSQPLATFDEAFKGHNFIVMMESYKGQWLPWKLDPIPNPLSPGESGFIPPWDYVKKLVEWFLEIVHNYILNSDDATRGTVRAGVEACKEPLKEKAKEHMHRLRSTRTDGRDRDLEELLSILRIANVPVPPEHDSPVPPGERSPDAVIEPHRMWWLYLEIAKAVVELIADSSLVSSLLGKALSHLWSMHWNDNTILRRARMLLDMGFAVVRGLIADGIIFPPHDWFSIDNYDLVAWLRKYGANEQTLCSPLIWAMKDAAYHSYHEIAAGTILHSMLRMLLTYRGNILYKMQAGMGDVIFAPIYEVLSRRGVRFEFFQYVRDIKLSADRSRVERIEMGRQATLKKEPYQPFINVKGLPCWTSTPDYDQLVEGKAIRDGGFDLEDWWSAWPDVARFELLAGRDFDEVVLGISIASFPYIAKELMDANPRFAAMVENVKTTQTMGVQLWFIPNLQQLGWELTSPVVIPYVEPLDTWADMTHLLPHENWPPGAINNLAYLTSAMTDDGPLPPRSDHGYAQRQNDRCKQITVDWLKTYPAPLWPKAVQPSGEIDWNLLYGPPSLTGPARMDAQYWRAPFSPSERYVLAVPNSSQYRLRPEESGFRNLVLTGDYTKNALSIGCLEATTMSGMLSARAIDPRVPKPKGDWLPELKPKSSEPTTDQNPPFIQMDGQLLGIPPIGLDTDVYMFLLPADYGKLRAICDQQLNLGKGEGNRTVYRPIGPFVVLYASYLLNYPQGNPIGYVPERDYGIWLPVFGGKEIGPVFVPERVLTYSPYIWVDNGLALIGGRTVYGFAKEMGEMTFPKDPKSATSFSLKTQVLPRYGQNQPVETRQLIEVQRKDLSIFEELRGLWEGAESVLDAFGESVERLLLGHAEVPVPSFKTIRELIENMTFGMRMVFLKQTPDAPDAKCACYQAIVETDIPITGGLKGGWLPGDYSVDIYRYESHQIVKTLGLYPVRSDEHKDTVVPLAHGWAKFQAVVQNGTIIWEAKTGRRP